MHPAPTSNTVLVDVRDAIGPARTKNTSDAYRDTGRISRFTACVENPLMSVKYGTRWGSEGLNCIRNAHAQT